MCGSSGSPRPAGRRRPSTRAPAGPASVSTRRPATRRIPKHRPACGGLRRGGHGGPGAPSRPAPRALATGAPDAGGRPSARPALRCQAQGFRSATTITTRPTIATTGPDGPRPPAGCSARSARSAIEPRECRRAGAGACLIVAPPLAIPGGPPVVHGGPGGQSSPRYALRTFSSSLSAAECPTARPRPSGARSRGGRCDSAWSAFCSTSRIVVPWALISWIDREDLLDEDRREAERRLVEEQQARLATSAPARWPASAARRPTACRPAGAVRSRSRGNRSKTRSRSGPIVFWSRVKAPIWRFSRTVRREKIRRPSGAWPMPGRTSWWAGRLRDVLALEADRALARVEQAADRLERRRLARAVGADERDDLAPADLDRDALEGVDVAVVGVDVVEARASTSPVVAPVAPAPAASAVMRPAPRGRPR